MIIKKVAIPRRTVLRGIGMTLALPLLDAMVPALSALTKTAAIPVRRLGFVYVPQGAVMDKWTPSEERADFELSPILSPLAPYRAQLFIPSGLGNKQAESLGDGGGDHSRAGTGWLSGIHAKRTEGADLHAGITADQIAALEIGKSTRLPSLEAAIEGYDVVGNCDVGYSCAYMNTISWRTPTTPLPMETNPRLLFERLFGDGDSQVERLAWLREDRSILDSVIKDVARFQMVLGSRDRARVDEYLEAVREVERRIHRAEEQQAELHLPIPQRPAGIPDTFEEHAKLMFDLQALAYQADITRVSTFLMAREVSQRTYPQIGVSDPHHALSHHQQDKEKLAKLAKINTHHVEMFAYFLKKLRETRDGDGSLLDHSMILYGSGISDGNTHNHAPLPLLIAGGGAGQIKGGRHVKYPKDTPMANLLLTLLDRVGVRTERLGDSTGRLELEHLSV